MVAFVEQHPHQIATQLVDMWRLVFDGQVGGGWLGAGCHAAPVYLDRAYPTAALMTQSHMIAKARDIDAGIIGGVHNGLAFFGCDVLAINLKGKAHLLKSLS